MARTMYDSTDPRNVPADAEIVAYYPHAWGSDLSHLISPIEVRIDNRGDHADDCHALDVENGAATIALASEWVRSWHTLHPSGMHTGNGFIHKPLVYISHGSVPALRAALSGLDYDLWDAWWNVGPIQVDNAWGHQYVDRGPHGENYDMTVVFDDTWGLNPAAPAPTPVPTPTPPPVAVIRGAVLWPSLQAPEDVNFARVQSSDGGKTWHE